MNGIVQPLPRSQRVLLAAVALGLVLSSAVQAAESAELGATLPPLLDQLERQPGAAGCRA